MESSNTQDILERYGGMLELAVENADPNNWEWDDRGWEMAHEGWQNLNTEWYGAAARSLGGPASPALSLPYLGNKFPSILVRDSYVTTFDHIWARAMQSEGETGTIITGQPGTGKTLFQYYLLVRLLQRKQVVLFSQDGSELILFYHNKVYRSTTFVLEHQGRLPEPKPWTLDVFIWSLFDIEEMTEPKSFLVRLPCLPVQSASPDPRRYKTWEKNQIPLFTALPLWSRDELVAGLPFQTKYPSLRSALHEFYASTSQNRDALLVGFLGASEVLKEREEDGVLPSPDDALNYLLEDAMYRFGYAARDVFAAVFNHIATTKRHEHAFAVIDYSQLKNAVIALASNGTPSHDISHRILALSPVFTGTFANVGWSVDFKSDWIAKCIVQKLGDAEDAAVRQQIKFLQSIPGASSLAGPFFEPVVHRIVVTSTGGIWPLTLMASNELDPPQFTQTCDPPPGDIQFAKAEREIVKFQDLAELPLKNNTYYVPEDRNSPLFDAFVVDIDRSNNSAILWILQVTVSKSHEGSSKGYQNVRKIMGKLKKTVGVIRVRYLLVASKGISRHQWQFPQGWNTNCIRNDHRGPVYYLEVSLTPQLDRVPLGTF